MNLQLERPLWERLRRFAFEHHRSQAEVVREALSRYLDEKERQQGGSKL